MMGINRTFVLTILLTALVRPSLAQRPELTPVVSKAASRVITIPGEIQPYLAVGIHARVTAFVERIVVDRGSVVKQGDLLATLSAPEMTAQITEAESKAEATDADRIQAEAQLAAEETTLERLQKAAETPGAIAGNEITVASKRVDAAKALVNSRKQANRAAAASVEALKALEAYLKITAPFDGVITKRLVHPGELVGPTSTTLLNLEQLSRLRVVVSVPEDSVGGVSKGATVAFRVPAYPERTFDGVVARISRVLDPKTRTMAVELDVTNKGGLLAPGMYPSVKWPVRVTSASLYVPKTSVVTTTERTFVIRDKGGVAEWVNVRKGAADDDNIEVFGPLHEGDRVVKRANDEIREGTSLR
jgi:RND family efflux transporter MFP subunit